ncbi:MAG: RNA methyltransferase [Alphaproteobacteria bacterium]|nr:RNA methyltransferase [Alphaproteobacteria bacterium]
MAELVRITSLQNALVKHARSLDRRKERKESGQFIAEGVKVIATARDRGWTPDTLFVADSEGKAGMVPSLIDWARQAGAQCVSINDKLAEALSARDNPQALIGVFRQRWASLPAKPTKDEVWVALEEIRDPGNLGTIIRTIDAVGAQGVILIGTCCDPFARDAVRASMGSIFSVPLILTTRIDFLTWCSGWPGEIVATHLKTATDYRRTYPAPTLLVMGSEGPGLSDELARTASCRVRIPMANDAADSLNLAVATGVMLYEIQRTRL